jgi:hypothetical protein
VPFQWADRVAWMKPTSPTTQTSVELMAVTPVANSSPDSSGGATKDQAVGRHRNRHVAVVVGAVAEFPVTVVTPGQGKCLSLC